MTARLARSPQRCNLGFTHRGWRRAGAALIGVSALVLTACGTSNKNQLDTNGRVTLRLEASSQAGGYPTPYAAIRGPGVLITAFMFDTLAYPDVTGQPKPWLAQSWTASPDGLTWTFHLHPNATWQDGQPLTAADVAFSFDYDLHGPGAATGVARGITYIKSVTAADPATVVIVLSRPSASFLSDISGAFGVPIVPKHIWSSVTDPAHFQGPQALIGSGPYELKKFTVSPGSYDFVANDNFYLGKPKVREIQMIQTADPLLALQRGELDAGSPFNDVTPQSQIDALSKRFTLLTAPGEFLEALFFNLAAGAPYDQTAFRQAVSYALDRQDMVNRLIGGRGIPGSAGGLGPDNPYLNNNVQAYPHDLAKAKALLDGLGYKDVTGDGMREAPDGSPFTIPLLTASADINQAQLVVQYLRAVGLNAKITSVDQATSDARDSKGDYKLAVIHFGGIGSDPNGLVQRFASFAKSKSFTRVHGYHNTLFDKLAKKQATTLNVAVRKQLVDQMQALLAQDVPQLPLYIPQQLTFVDAQKFHGWAYTPGCPPCGATMNKTMLLTGNTAPRPDNPGK